MSIAGPRMRETDTLLHENKFRRVHKLGFSVPTYRLSTKAMAVTMAQSSSVVTATPAMIDSRADADHNAEVVLVSAAPPSWSRPLIFTTPWTAPRTTC